MSFFNYFSLFLGAFECFLFPSITLGFPIVQFIFEEQKIFMNEKCSEDEIKNEVYCEEAKAVFGDLFVSSAFLFILRKNFLEPRYGCNHRRIIRLRCFPR